MKKYRTRFLKITSMTWLLFPVSYLLFATLLFDLPASKVFSILLSPIFYVLCSLGVITGYGFHVMARWAWYTFLSTSVLIAYYNAVVLLEYSASQNKLLAFLVSLVLLVGLIYWVAREVRVPYFFPKIRWWESNPRYKLSIPAKIVRASGNGSPLQGEIMDLSSSGCFIKLPDIIPIDELIEVQFDLFGRHIDCQGTAVWQASGAVTHPKGIGIKFAPMVRSQRRLFKVIQIRLERIASLYQSNLHVLDKSAFQRQLEELHADVSIEAQDAKKA